MRVLLYLPCCKRFSHPVEYFSQRNNQRMNLQTVEGGTVVRHEKVERSICGKEFQLPILKASRKTMEVTEKAILEPLEDGNYGMITFVHVIVVDGAQKQEIVYFIRHNEEKLLVKIAQVGME